MTRIKHLFLTLLLTTGGSLCPAEPNAVPDTIRPMVPDVLTDTLTTELPLGDTMPTTFNKKTPLHPPDMNTQHPIPEVVLECARSHGQPHVEYVTRDHRGEIYTASLPPDFEPPLPPCHPGTDYLPRRYMPIRGPRGRSRRKTGQSLSGQCTAARAGVCGDTWIHLCQICDPRPAGRDLCRLAADAQE